VAWIWNSRMDLKLLNMALASFLTVDHPFLRATSLS
jgi:hypothetical protein